MRDPTKRVTALQGLPIDKRTRRKTSPHLYIAAAHAQIRGPYWEKSVPLDLFFTGTDFGVSENVYMIGASLSEPHLGPYGGCGLSRVRPAQCACAKFTWTAFQVQRSVEAGQLEKRPG